MLWDRFRDAAEDDVDEETLILDEDEDRGRG